MLVNLLGALIAAALAFCLAASSAFATTPGVNTLPALNVGYSSATLSGDVDPNGEATTTYFEYGTTVAYGSKTAEVGAGSGSTAINVSKGISSLTPNAEYHYRIVAVNASGESKGADKTFRLGWKVQSPAGSAWLEDVSCSAATDCVAVGGSTAERWDGSKWQAQTVPGSLTLNGVSCFSSTACMAVGSGASGTAAAFWNGTEWKAQTTPNPVGSAPKLEDVSCASATQCTAVGTYSSSGTTKTIAMGWAENEWKLQTTPSPTSMDNYLTSVSCPSAGYCMATGFYYVSPSGPWAPMAMHWGGSEWTLQAPQKPAGATMSWLYGVSCTSSSSCVAIGDKEVNAGTHQYETMAQRWNGTEWKLESTPNPESTNRNVTDVSCTSSTDCTAVGSYVVTGGSGDERPLGLRWNGASWALEEPSQPAGATKSMPKSVSCVAARGCAMVGRYRNASSVWVPLSESNWRAQKPTVTTKAASGVAETTATLKGDVNPNGSPTMAYFEYGTTTAYGTKTAELSIGSGTSAVEKSQALSGLSPNTTYHYRFVANNENPETSNGADQTFTTIGPPQVTTGTGEPDPTTGEAATLNATVDPNGQSTAYQFEYGTSSGSYTTTVPIPAESAGSGMSGVPVSYKITGLTRGKTYYFRVTATNASGKVNGSEKSFTTQNAPGATTGSAVKIGKTGATLNGFVTPNGLETKFQFEYGLTTSYGSKAPVPAKGPATGAVEQAIGGLEGKTLYHYRLVAENALGTTYGADKTFTTLPKVKLKVGGSLIAVGAPIKAFSSNAVFAGITCGETEFSGLVSENPGAMQTIATAKALKCTYMGAPFTISIPTKGMTLEYGTNAAGVLGNAVVSKFTIVGTWAFGTCEYEVQLAGMYLLTLPTQLELSGEAKFVKGPFTCPTGGSASGKFAVTSGGTAVVAET